ncbi:MAG: hypothetical protein LBI79_01630 [Nitrososphaerota archaeon]|jgi:hypothetical protein|nr:hypothetical protein [Nitrososphaerota archaeon]
MTANNNKWAAAKSNMANLIASLFILFGSLIVFAVLRANLTNGFIDFGTFIIGVEMQLIGLGLIIICKWNPKQEHGGSS